MLHRDGRRALVSDLKAPQAPVPADRARRRRRAAKNSRWSARRSGSAGSGRRETSPNGQGAARRLDEAGDAAIPRGAIVRCRRARRAANRAPSSRRFASASRSREAARRRGKGHWTRRRASADRGSADGRRRPDAPARRPRPAPREARRLGAGIGALAAHVGKGLGMAGSAALSRIQACDTSSRIASKRKRSRHARSRCRRGRRENSARPAQDRRRLDISSPGPRPSWSSLTSRATRRKAAKSPRRPARPRSLERVAGLERDHGLERRGEQRRLEKTRKSASSANSRIWSPRSIARVTPPGRKARLCGHLPAMSPMVSSSARAPAASRASLPASP